jgi:hypothetical protein
MVITTGNGHGVGTVRGRSGPVGSKGNDDHETVIIVNTREKTVERNKDISFEEVVSLAYDGNPPSGPYLEFTVMYRRGHGNKDGSLVASQNVKVKDGMVFSVSATDRS